MRLLYTAKDGRLGWTDDLVGDQIAPCAVLSHTWDGQEVAFRRSRWFTRDWTLQELLALASVTFYSKEEELLANKGSLQDTIHEITGIPVEALQGKPLSEFGLDERFSWAAERRTIREADRGKGGADCYPRELQAPVGSRTKRCKLGSI
jgi:hypothetical protein